MPETSRLSKYLKADNVKDGYIINFMDAGVIIDKTFKKDGKDETKPVLEMTVEVNGETKTYSPNGTTVGLLSKAWGTSTESWVGKQAVITLIPAPNGKDMIIAKPKA
jgi:hypothetical protein